ncbi:hypothetical protein [Succinivibrio sp.]|uniref:hypothetical protein n=1 Tax=Succinivibrio sp. TaxID=2053619 RepID=UPI0025FA98E1|nr:hypothetical protein [Succinivibrio sp.]MBQ9219713.1 hypothetical protein [Succinivibrio sp.]
MRTRISTSVDDLVEEFLRQHDLSPPEIAEEFFKKITDPQIVKQNVQAAIEKDWSLGIPVMQMDAIGLYELKPNGKKIYTEPCPKDSYSVK